MSLPLRRPEVTLIFYSFSFLFVCALLGISLEILLAYKSAFLLGPEHETRRLLLRLGHAHGSLLSLFSLLWIAIGRLLPATRTEQLGRLYLLSALLMGAGFSLAGITANERDPGFIIVLVPIGAALFLISLGSSALLAFRALRQSAHEDEA